MMVAVTSTCSIDNDKEDDDSRSVDTDEAFMDMLGLSLEDMESGMTTMVEEGEILISSTPTEIGKETKAKIITKDSNNATLPSVVYNAIDLPPRCSRHLIHPSSCFALVIDNVLTESQCQYLIQKAHSSSSRSTSASDASANSNINSGSTTSSFRYITEATHRAPDGTSYTVQIQNPNPHKLAVIDTDHDGDDNLYGNDKRSDMKEMQRAAPAATTTATATATTSPTHIMNELYATISKVLDELLSSSNSSSSSSLSISSSYQNFVSRTNCSKHRGLNPRMRILKYDAIDNDKFDAHFDATTFVQCKNTQQRPQRRQSLITVLVYLNNGDGIDFSGGETVYLDYHNSLSTRSSTRNKTTASTRIRTTSDDDKNKFKTNSCNNIKIIPKVGRVVLFEHDLFHSGSMLDWGTKYIMRTDVLFDEQQEQQQHQNKNEMMNGKDHEQEKRAKEGEETSVNNDNDVAAVPIESLLSNICDEMELSPKSVQILSEMDLLNVSLYAFLSPGVTLLKMMLIDGGLEETVVQKLIQRAIVLTSNQK